LRPYSTIWCTTKPRKKKKARIEARFGALEHDLMQSDARQAVKKSTRWHDLVRWGTISCTTSRRKRKSMHWSTIWYATNREKKKRIGAKQDLVHDKPRKKTAI